MAGRRTQDMSTVINRDVVSSGGMFHFTAQVVVRQSMSAFFNDHMGRVRGPNSVIESGLLHFVHVSLRVLVVGWFDDVLFKQNGTTNSDELMVEFPVRLLTNPSGFFQIIERPPSPGISQSSKDHQLKRR